MDKEPGGLDLDKALEQSGWLRSLAIHLVGPDQADDLVQDAWVRALERPPRKQTSLRNWLARVLTTLSLNLRRSEARRKWRERSVAGSQAIEAPDETAAVLDVQEQVMQAVQALREPYRTAVVLRYFEGMTTNQIAQRLKVPPSTAGNRVARGRHALRQNLEARHGKGWRDASIALLMPSGASIFPPTANLIGLETLVMTMKGKLILAATALAVITGIFLWPESSLPLSQTTESELSQAVARSDDRPVAEGPSVFREEVTDEDSELYPHWTTPPDREFDLHGLVLGPDSQPFAGAQVVVFRPAKQGVSTLDLEWNAITVEIGSTLSNEDGEFRLRVDRGSRYDLDVSSGGLQAPLFKGSQAGDRVVIRLEPGASIEGVVTDAETGDPVEGAPVTLFRPGGVGRRFQTQTDHAGHYLVAGLTSGKWYLELNPQRLKPPDWVTLKVVLGEHLVRDFELSRGFSTHGRIIDAKTRKPIEGAEVSNNWVFRRVTKTDADGRYELSGLASIFGKFMVHARAEGYGGITKNRKQENPDTETNFALLSANTVVGTVRHENGEPANGVYVAAVASSFDTDGNQQADWQSSRSGADGRFEIRNVRPDLNHALRVMKQGHGSLIYEFPLLEHPQGRIDLGVIIIPPSGWISGTVIDESGAGVARLELELTGWNEDRGRFRKPRDKELDSYLSILKMRTDDLGRFRFNDLAKGTYTLKITRAGRQQIGPRQIAVATGQGTENIEILIPVSGVIAGAVLGPDGAPFPQANVSLRSELGSEASSTWVAVDEIGRFRFEGVTPGTYQINARPGSNWDNPSESEVLLSTRMDGVEAGQEGLSLMLRRGRTITGNVVDALGNPVPSAGVKAFDMQGRQVLFVFANPKGFFSLALPVGEVVDLEVQPPYQSSTSTSGIPIWISNSHPARVRREGVTSGASDLVLRLPWEPNESRR